MKTKVRSILRLALCVVLMSVMACTAVACGEADTVSGPNNISGGSGSSGSGAGSGGSSSGGGSSGGGSHVADYVHGDVGIGAYEGVSFKSDTYKLGYRTKEQIGEDIVDSVAERLVLSFVETFGYGNGIEGHQYDVYYDSIRYNTRRLSGTYVAETGKCWIWMLGNEENKPLSFGIHERAKERPVYDEAVAEEYRNVYCTFYNYIMKAVLYEMLLGKEDWESAVKVYSFLDENGFPIVKYRGSPVVLENGVPKYHIWNNCEVDTIKTLKQAYSDRATYYGFTESHAQKIKEYIYEYVIGSIASAGQMDMNRYYRQYVENLVDSLIYAEGPDGKPSDTYYCARISYVDAPLTLNKYGRIFTDIEKLEYQSIVFMPGNADVLKSCWIAFECKYSMNLSAYFRYYNGTIVMTTSPQSFSLTPGIFDMELNFNGMEDFSPEFKCSVNAFDNNSAVAASEAKANLPDNRVYKAIPAVNGAGMIGVLDESKVNSSFVEIVISVDRESYAEYEKEYAFKVAILNTEWQNRD